jgi:chemotaxis protein CheX
LETFKSVFEKGQPVVEELHLLEPFMHATRTAIREMVASEVNVQGMARLSIHEKWGDIAAVIGLSRIPRDSPPISSLILSFPQRTAAALAERMMMGINFELDQNLIRDCMGEIANVIAGQAKAMLDETPFRYVFTLPPAVADVQETRCLPDLECLMVGFTCDQGEFVLQLSLEL